MEFLDLINGANGESAVIGQCQTEKKGGSLEWLNKEGLSQDTMTPACSKAGFQPHRIPNFISEDLTADARIHQ